MACPQMRRPSFRRTLGVVERGRSIVPEVMVATRSNTGSDVVGWMIDEIGGVQGVAAGAVDQAAGKQGKVIVIDPGNDGPSTTRQASTARSGVRCWPMTSRPSSSRRQNVVRSGVVKVASGTSRSSGWAA
jgi:hypothetical protein